MEIRNGIVQAAGVKIREHHLEIAERFARAAHNAQVVAGVERDGRHVVAQTPETVVIEQVVDAFVGVMEVQAFGFGMLFADVLGYAINILHQLDGVLERIGVDALNQIGFDFRHTSAVIADIVDLVSVVYVAHFDFFIGKKRTLDPEKLSDREQLARDIRIHRRQIHD